MDKWLFANKTRNISETKQNRAL